MATTAMTVTQQIAYGKALKISTETTNYQSVLSSGGDKLVINFESLLTSYRYFFDQLVITYDLNDDQYLNYRFQPKKLSYDLYGTVELAPLLLNINNVVSVSEFDFQSPKIFKSSILDFINEVLNKEKIKITANNKQINTDLNT